MEKNAVNYLHEIALEILTVHSSSVASVIDPVSGLSILSVHPSDVECQEIPVEITGTNYREKTLVGIMAKSPDDIILILQYVKFLEKSMLVLMGLTSK